MNTVQLNSILGKIQKELTKREEVWERLKKDMRRATRLSKQAILFAHQERNRDGRKLLEEVNELFSKLRKISKEHPDLVYTGMVDSAFQEYTEAQTFLSLIEEDRFIDPEELGIPYLSYVLGLADVVGEFRRRALDALRKGDLEKAEGCLQRMEQIYLELTDMEEGYHLVSGLRRKCDIARRIIESTRGDVTIAARRASLELSIKKLEKTMRRRTDVEEAS